MNAQADLDFHCPHMPADIFLHGAALIMGLSNIRQGSYKLEKDLKMKGCLEKSLKMNLS